MNTNYAHFENFLRSAQVPFRVDEPLKNHTSFKIGGPADFFVEPESIEDFQMICRKIKELELPFFVLGNGSNLLVSDSGYRGVILKISDKMDNIRVFKNVLVDGVKRNFLVCSAGTNLSRICTVAAKNSLSGLEFAFGIPGSLGGGIFMNAGAYGGELKDVVRCALHVDSCGELGFLRGREMNFSYRKSFYSQKVGENIDNLGQRSNFIILEAILELHSGSETEITRKMADLSGKRRSKQPLDLPSAGSVFKRPEGHFVGPMIEKCGLKGRTFGGAQVSEKHAGFIVNIGDATCSDVLNLVEIIKKSVRSKFGVDLHCEFKILGEV